MSKAPTIMLVKNRALGDSIMGLASVQYLKHLYPKSNIIYAVPQWIAPLYSESITAADSIYALNLSGIDGVVKLLKDVKKLKIDHIHEMHQSGRGAKFLKWISFICGIRYTAHNHHLKRGSKVIDQGKILPLIQRDLDGVFSFLGRGEKPAYLNYCPKLNPKETRERTPTIVMGVVATRQTKMWPLENYIELAQLIYKNYPHYSIIIPLSKSVDDQKIKESLIALGLPRNTSIKEINLNQLPAEFKKAVCYVGNDTGLKHLAIAVGLKTFTFFGPEPANEWHPYDKDAHPYFYLENLTCRTRTFHYCGLSICDLEQKNMHCLTSFLPTDVFNKIERELS